MKVILIFICGHNYIYRQIFEDEKLTGNEKFVIDLTNEIAWVNDKDHLLDLNYFNF